jgi:multidrug efflux system outer membrane protein
VTPEPPEHLAVAGSRSERLTTSKSPRLRQAAGKGTDLDIADTSAKLDMVRAQVETTNAAYGKVRRALEVLLGRYPAAEVEAAMRLPPLPPPVTT